MSPTKHAADSHDLIRVVGARENNLKDICVEIPKHRLTVFTGVGVGQEFARVRHHRSRVAADDQRDLQRVPAGIHALDGAARRRPARRADHRHHRRPGTDGRECALDRRHRDRHERDVKDLVLASRQAACRPAAGVLVQCRLDQRGGGAEDVKGRVNLTFAGLIPSIQKSFLSKDVEAMQPHIRVFVDRAVVFATCPDCDGTRLAEHARSSKIGGRSIADCCSMQISDLAEWVRGLAEPSVAPLLGGLQHTLDKFVEIGLGYLSLDRPSGTLSGGEAQRTKMIRHLGSSLTDVTYVFDEPTIGMHPHDIQRMNNLLLRLRDKGNTVLVVEHKPEAIAIADHVVDLGPGAGTAGGEVVFEGTVGGLRESGTLTGKHLDDRASLKSSVRAPSGALEVRGADTNNLQDVDVDIPLGVLVVVTGVAGSGKSSLIGGSVSGRDGVVSVDQGAIKGSRRSNPATYTGLLDPIRKAFAKVNGVKPALFSANSEGACPTCNGAGVIYTELGFMETVSTPCEECEGKRFEASVLEYKFGGRDISEVLAMSVAQAEAFFADGEARTPAAHRILERMDQVGLGYLTLGQPLTTLSGGERQRLKLATHMGDKGGIYVLDEPTTGLHLADVEHLLGLLDRLVDSGKSVIVIEHHQAVMAHADWIIDMGPAAGHDGGRVVFEGTPADLVATRSTLTGQHLAAYVAT